MSIFKNISLVYLLNIIKNTFLRFPLSFIFSFFIAMFMHLSVISKNDLYFRSIIFFTLAFIMSLTLYLFKERNALSKLFFWILIFLSLLWSAYSSYFEYEIFNSLLYMKSFIIYVIALLALGSIPIVLYKDEKKFYFYLNSIIMALFISLAYTIALEILSMVALSTIDILFKLHINKFYQYISIWIFMFFLPIAFLSRLKKDDNEVHYSMHEKFSKYILLPALLVYFLIIITYLTKIIYQSSWPHGGLSFLILWFISIGFILIFFLVPLSSISWVLKVRKAFLYTLLPLVGVLVLAWYQRFEAYGLTIWRYYLLIIIFWILISALYLLFSKKKQLQNILVLLSILGFFTLYGPLNGTNMSNLSQVNKILNYAQKNEMIEDGCLVKNTNLDTKIRIHISSSLRYLDKHKGLHLLENKFCKKPKLLEPSEYAKSMGFELMYNSFDNRERFYHNRQDRSISFASAGEWITFGAYDLRHNKRTDNLSLKKNIIIYENNQTKIHFDLNTYFQNAINLDSLENKNAKVLGDMVGSFVLFDNISGYAIEGQDTNITNFSGHVFIPLQNQ